MCRNLNILDESGTDEAECRRKVGSGRRVAVAIRSLVNARVSHESLHVGVLMYSSEKEKSRTRTLQMDNLKGLLGIRRMDKVQNAWIKELCGVTKGPMKAFSDGSAMWREWIMTGFLKGYM